MKYIFIALIVVVVYFAYGGSGVLLNQYDDSYITYRYAYNLADGHGIVFNIGEHIDATSSFLYTVILATTYKITNISMEK